LKGKGNSPSQRAGKMTVRKGKTFGVEQWEKREAGTQIKKNGRHGSQPVLGAPYAGEETKTIENREKKKNRGEERGRVGGEEFARQTESSRRDASCENDQVETGEKI